jgi:outer membrane protein OmpA-like peptidoglycan-associated protein
MNTRKKMNTLVPVLIGAALVVGCAHEAGKELQDARVAYNQAQQSPARDMAPDKLYEAKQALERAENVNLEESGDSDKERDMAYIAHRKADLAVVYGKLEAMQRLRADAMAQQRTLLEEQRDQMASQLQQTESDLEQAQISVEDMERQLGNALEQFGKLEQNRRDMVLTIDGAVLFETGKSELMPMARTRLKDVAKVLEQYSEKEIVVEGHADATGPEELNKRLSQARAESVRQLLVDEGVPADRVTAEGRGEAEPVASNTSPEGRANNRRVEITIKDAGDPSA